MTKKYPYTITVTRDVASSLYLKLVSRMKYSQKEIPVHYENSPYDFWYDWDKDEITFIFKTAELLTIGLLLK